MKQNSFLLLPLLALSATISATNYYCSPTGNADGRTYQSPCSFTDGVKKITSAGDTLFCLGGQYDFTSAINITLSGTSGNNIVICNYPGEQAILDWRREAYGERGLVVKTGSQYLTIKGLTLRYTGKNALLNNGSYCTFENLDTYGNGDTGIQMKGGGNNYIINCDSHDNFDYKLGGLTAADFGGNADGFADKQFTGAANTYIGCRAWNNSDDGWDFFQRYMSGSEPIVMHNCICYRNGPVTYDMTNHARYETDKSWFDQFKTEITITDADGAQIKASLTKYPNIGNGNGFKLGGGMTTCDVNLYNCLAVGNHARGFDQNNNFGAMVIYNGSAYANGTDYGFANNGGGSLVIRNCISYTNSYNFRISTTQSNNSWSNANLKPTATDFVSMDTTLILSPRKADYSLPEIAFMHLQEDSKFIDAGVDVGLAYNGKAPDLGCYEFGSTIGYPATLTCTTNNLNQSVKSGSPIENITLKWGGSATDAAVSNLPQGLTENKNIDAQTITISGTPQFIGSESFVVTTQGGSSEVSLTITIIVKDNSAYEIGYVTLAGSDADKPMLDRLNSNSRFSVNIVDANSNKNDYSRYDLIVISPVPSSTSAAMAGLKGIDKPLLLLKPFMLKNTVWNWGDSRNSSNSAMRIVNPHHKIFKDMFINNNVPETMEFFSSVNNNGVTYIASWYSATEPEQIATPIDGGGSSIAEIKPGTDMNGTIISKPLLMIGISEYSTANLTDEAAILIENACLYLLHADFTDLQTPDQSEYTIRQYADHIEIIGTTNVTINLYDILGRQILTTPNTTIHTANIPSGIYILTINGTKTNRIIIR